MEEVSRCNIQKWVKPEDRIHLHDHKWNLVHVHMAASTWWDLFTNLLWWMGSGYLADDFGKIYTPKDGKYIYYFLNWKRIDNPANTMVESEDRLLVWYGTWTEEEVWKNLIYSFQRMLMNIMKRQIQQVVQQIHMVSSLL